MMNYPILYSFRRCPYAMRARMGLRLNHITVEIREVALRNKPPAMLEASPKGTVPILVFENSVIDESIDIVYWAMREGKQETFLENESKTRDFMKHHDHLFKTSLTYYKYPDRDPSQAQEEHRAACEVFLKDFEKRLSETAYLFSDRLEVVDFCVYPFVRQLAKIDEIWFEQAPYPNLKRWKEAFDQNNLFLSVMTKRNPWQEGDEPTLEDWQGSPKSF